jgi:hypothetical protein
MLLKTSLTLVLLLILHSLKIVQILDLVLCLVKSLNTGPLSLDVVVMIICHHIVSCLLCTSCGIGAFFHPFRFAVRLPGPLPLVFMMVFLSFGLNVFFYASLLLHFIV